MIKEMIQTLNETNNFSTTENGSKGYSTTDSKLVDLNFRIPSMRNGLTKKDENDFIVALNENIEYAIKWLFYLRDVRGGIGERNIFINLYKVLYTNKPKYAISCLDLIAEYGRWKDLIDITFCGDNNLQKYCLDIIEKQLKSDAENVVNGKPISLIAKWLPSINASKQARNQAKRICNHFEIPFVMYRKMLSKFRNYLDVTEVKTCSNRWDEIDYNKVSSNANLKYSNAFMKHDAKRRREYLTELLNTPKNNSSVKMNASVLFPHEIWAKYANYNYFGKCVKTEDLALEAMWKNLKDMGSCGNTMCVVDGSGSMTMGRNKNVSPIPINIARSLGVYFAERCTGEFHNMMIEFSSHPRIIDINGCENLMDKINHLSQYTECSNTNIEKTFMLILDTAVKNHMSQEDMPERILIVSDMEFDNATTSTESQYKTLFDTIQERFEIHGYKMPKLVFWNVNSRTNTIPVKKNDYGVILVSGFSVNIVNMVMSGQTDPWLALKEVLDSDRYDRISNTIKLLNND